VRSPSGRTPPYLTWLGIVRLGLVQTCLGAIVVLTTSTMNRVMVVEHMLPAMIPGLLVALHYLVQLSRPRLGHASDVAGRRTPWIVGGMGVLAAGALLAAVATALMALRPAAGIALAVVAFALIGIGVGAGGTSLLALLAKRVAPERRPAAGSIVWMMMIAGFIVTAVVAGHFLDPFTPLRLVQVTGCVAAVAFLVSVASVWGVEPRFPDEPSTPVLDSGADTVSFRIALSEVWADASARQFTVFVFVSMLAYSAQDLILEPFAGMVFGMTPGESTQLSGVQNAGVLAGMLIIAVFGTLFPGRTAGSLRFWILTGCTGSALALGALGAAGLVGPTWPLSQSVFLLGLANGAFAVAAIGAMMALAGRGPRNREGVRMGLWGAAQAMAFALGGFAGTLMLDVLRWVLDGSTAAYSFVFAAEALLFLAAARMAADIDLPSRREAAATPSPAGDIDWRYTS